MAQEQRYYLGILADEASVKALLTDGSGRLIGVGSNDHFPGPRGLFGIETASRAALDGAGLTEADLAVAAVAADLGASSPRSTVSGLFPDTPVVAADPLLAELTGAAAGREGILLRAFGDVVAYGRSAEGGEARAGGWGPRFSGDGGAEWVGMEGVRAALRAQDGRAPHTLLVESLPARFVGVTDVPGVAALLANGQASATDLAADVAADAARGDNAARNILNHAALHQANAAAAVYRGLWEAGTQVAVYPSGPLSADPFLSEQLDGWLVKLAPGLTRRAPMAPPVAGALLLAFGAAGITPDELDWDALLRGLSEASF